MDSIKNIKRMLSRRNDVALLLSLFLVLFMTGCNVHDTSIPERQVYLRRNIITENLTAFGSYLYVDKPKFATDRIGFGGIIIIHANDANYYAFELACPVEINEKILIGKPDALLKCKCSICGEIYNLDFGLGVPLNKISKEGLRRYNVSIDDYNNITVTK
jgi:hypothetical protein